MGSASSFHRIIYLDVDGRIQKLCPGVLHLLNEVH